MRDKKGDSEIKTSEDFDLRKELSTLVSQKVISQKIAVKLEQRLREKNVRLNKEQLHILVYKIREVINDIRSGRKPTMGKPGSEKDNLIRTLERLEERVADIEGGGGRHKTRVVTTEDIRIPGRTTEVNYEWDMDPLTDIPNDPESIIVLMKWLQYLVDKCGHSQLPVILDYYVDIGWISDDTKISLLDYSQGITDEDSKQDTKNKNLSNLPAKDHIQSLLFIQKLKGVNFDKHFLDRIEGDLSRITRKLDNYKFK